MSYRISHRSAAVLCCALGALVAAPLPAQPLPDLGAASTIRVTVTSGPSPLVGESPRVVTIRLSADIVNGRVVGRTSSLDRNPYAPLGRFVSLLRDDVPVADMTFPSPLGPNAARHYAFAEVAGGGDTVRRLSVRPLGEVGFTGFIVLRRSDGRPLHARLTLDSSLPRVPLTGYHIEQWYEREGARSYARRTEIEGELTIAALDPFLEPVRVRVEGEHVATPTATPTATPRTVSSTQGGGDSTSLDADGYLRGTSITTTRRGDDASLLADVDSALQEEHGRFRFGTPLPYIDFNRSGSATLGLAISPSFGPVSLAGRGAWSFGLQRPLGELAMTLELLDEPALALSGGAYSRLATTTTDELYPRVMNTLVAATLHQDYYDYYRADGGAVALEASFASIDATLRASSERHFSTAVTTDRSIVFERAFQENPEVAEGEVRRLTLLLGHAPQRPLLGVAPRPQIDLRWNLVALAGEYAPFAGTGETAHAAGGSFASLEGRAELTVPILFPGYEPPTVKLMAAFGEGGDRLPPQLQFRLQTSAAHIGHAAGFLAAPKGIYGGTDYQAVGVEINTRDLLWRTLGLPTWRGRGPELIATVNGGRFHQGGTGPYMGTDGLLIEAGIGIGSIPVFVTDIVTLRFEGRVGIGEVERGRFGANLTIERGL